MPEHEIGELLRQRILILDGAMGTMIQRYRLDEAAFRGERFKNWKKDLKGHNDLLNVTRPAVIEEIHRRYLEAGADIVETNTFNSQAVSLADYDMADLGYELSKAGAECARRAVAQVTAAQPARRCFVAGAIGPTTKTSSVSTDSNDAAARGCTFQELVAAYADHGIGHLHPGRQQPRLFRADGRGILEFHLARAVAQRGDELCVGAEGNASPDRRAGADCADLREQPSECRPAQSLIADRFSRNARVVGAAVARVGAERLAQHCGRLLRDDTGPHSFDRRGRAGSDAQNVVQGSTVSAFERPGSADGAARVELRQYRRADEHHRVTGILEIDPGRRLRQGPHGGASAGRGWGTNHRHQHG